jgi:hypothetical protein
VASSPKTGFTSEETLTMQCASEDGTAMTLTLTLPKHIEASRVAAEMAERAARYRLSSEELDAETRVGIESHLDSQSRIAGAEKQVFEMAAPRPVSDHSARIAPQAGVLTEQKGAAPESVSVCAGCGEGVDLEDAFCSACGEQVV